MNLTLNRNRLLNLFRRLPMKAEMIGMLNRWNRWRLARLKTPKNLIFFVTNRCNARCQHCFYWRNLNQAPEEITLEQVRSVVRSLRHRLDTLMLTGGEPLLRSDLVEIMGVFANGNRTRKIHLTTNGSLPERLEQICREALSRFPVELSVQISLDGDEEYHNQLRGGDFYGRAVESLKRLQPLTAIHRNFLVSASTTLNRDNLRHLEHLSSLTRSLGVAWGFSLMRGTNYGIIRLAPEYIQDYSPRDEACQIPELSAIRDHLARLAPAAGEGDLRDLLQHFIWKHTLTLLGEQRSLIQCVAGRADGVLYPDGNVALCEVTTPFANLRDYDYDFFRLWNSAAAVAMRKHISCCSCIHGCHLVDSMKYDYRFLLETAGGDGPGKA